MDRPHWNKILDALLEDADFCEDGVTTIARDGAIGIPGVFYNNDDGQEAIEENEVPQIIAGSTSFPTPSIPGCTRGSQCRAEVQRFLRSQKRCKWQSSGTAHEALEHSMVQESGKQTHGAVQYHERDTWTSSRGDQSRGDSINGMEHCVRSNSGNASHNTWCTCDARHSSTLCLGNF